MPSDIELTRERDVEIDGGGDLPLVTGIENAEQSVGIEVGVSVRPNLGSRLTNQTLEQIRGTAAEIIRDDPAVEDVTSVRIKEVNKQTDTVSLNVELSYTDIEELEIDV